MNHSSLSKFRHLRLKAANLLDLLITKTVQIALEAGIMDAIHTNAMFQHISPREELMKRAKALRKAVYTMDPAMKEKMPKKRERTGLLEDQIAYCKELIKVVDSDARMETFTKVAKRNRYLKEGVEDTEIELEYAKDQDAKVGHKTADTSFFGY